MLSVIIPVYNEEKIIKTSVTRLTEYLRSLCIPFEVLISDDGSRDSGAGIVSSLSQKYSEIRLLCNPLNRGKGAAVRDGMLSAKGDVIVFTDCDLIVYLRPAVCYFRAFDVSHTVHDCTLYHRSQISVFLRLQNISGLAADLDRKRRIKRVIYQLVYELAHT